MAAKATLKTPKGTRDWVGEDLVLRDRILKTLAKALTLHGATPLDTPTFELSTTLSQKYGPETETGTAIPSRLIYNLQPQGGSEPCSLRYDLTVPFARWLVSRTDVRQVRRYQVAKVFRRDQPAVARGRMREFCQCDFDIAGVYDAMIPDAEVLSVVKEGFGELGIGVVVKVNHRRVLDGVFEVAGVPGEMVRGVSSAVDKLDKVPWGEVRRRLGEKGLAGEVADRVGAYVQRRGDLRGMLELIEADAELSSNKSVMEGLADMKLLASYLEALDVIDTVSFDLSLARGLDYYTGLIYEVVVKDSTDPPTRVGSIAAGGRYDDLVGMYGRRPLPCVGVSFGIDRIFTVLDARRKKKVASDLKGQVDVYIMAFGGKEFDGLLLERMRVARQLWAAGIRAEFAAKVKPKPLQQFNASEGVLVAVMLGQDELAAGQVRVKLLQGSKEATQKDRGQLVAREDLVEEVKKLLVSATSEQE